jgi:WhiB family redox-sensing transcriptional regulator
MLVAWRERIQANGEEVDDSPDDEDRRLLTLTPVSR